MNFEEHAAKPLLQAAGIAIPRGRLARSAGEARAAAAELGGPVVVKAQAPTGKRGKAGGIRTADDAAAAGRAAEAILGMDVAGHRVESVLVEARAAIAAEYYAAVLNDAASKGPLVMFSPEGGMDVEEVAASMPDRLRRAPVDVARGLDLESARAMLEGLGLGAGGASAAEPAAIETAPAEAAMAEAAVAETAPAEAAMAKASVAETAVAETAVAGVLVALYRAYRDNDAELLEVNPLARLEDGRLVALDCKFTLDDSAVKRREALADKGSPERLTELEARGQALGLKYIELDGDVGVLANGAGLTMTTMDVVTHHGGRPANFLEIGGEAYTKAKPALELVLDNPRVRSLVVNFCGAFARTDVMTGGVLDAWEALAPSIPIFFSVHGTGSAEARAMLRERFGVAPCETMDEAIAAAVAAAADAAVGEAGAAGESGREAGQETDGAAGGKAGRETDAAAGRKDGREAGASRKAGTGRETGRGAGGAS